MAKDPAFLFYPNDWLGGTVTFSRAHKGAYMDLLMAQYSCGHMTIDDIQTVLGPDFESMWLSKLKNKFIQDDNGLYYNEKLEGVIQARATYTQSRRDNLSSKKIHMGEHKASHMGEHMGNGNGNGNINKDLGKEGVGEKPKDPPKELKTWRTDFDLYLNDCLLVYNRLIKDRVWIKERERYHPGIDIVLSLEKAFKEFWGIEAGWKHKKKSRAAEIDWTRTFTNALDLKSNQVRIAIGTSDRKETAVIRDIYASEKSNEEKISIQGRAGFLTDNIDKMPNLSKLINKSK